MHQKIHDFKSQLTSKCNYICFSVHHQLSIKMDNGSRNVTPMKHRSMGDMLASYIQSALSNCGILHPNLCQG